MKRAGIVMQSRTVNTAGLTREQTRLAIAYVSAEFKARAAVRHADRSAREVDGALERANGALERAKEAADIAGAAERAFARAVPDWAERLSERA